MPGMAYRCRNDKDWTMEFASEGCQALTGYSPDDFVQNRRVTYNEIIHPEDRERIWKEVQEALDKQESFRLTYRIITEQGYVRWVWEQGMGIFSPQKELLFLEGFIMDITERKLSEAELHRNQMLLEHAQKIAKIGYWEFDLLKGTVWASLAAQQIYGLGESEWTIKKVQQIPLPEYRMALDEKMQGLIYRGDKYDIEFKIRRPTDKAIVDIHSIAEYNPSEMKIFGIIQDITERKQADEALRESEERFRRMAEASPVSFWMASPDWSRVMYLSPAFERITGISPEVIYKNPRVWLDIIHPEDLNYIKTIFTTGIDQDIEYEFRIIRKDGTQRWIHTRRSAIRNNEGKIISITGLAQDITEQKLADEERKIYEARLMRAQKLEAIGTLAGGIAHDFNNILSAIIGYSELAEDDLPADSPAHESIKEVIKAGDRAKDLVKQILTFSRQMETERRPVKAHLIIKEALKLLRSSIPSTITITESIDPSSGTVFADPTQIHQVIMNLCTNAYHAMLPDGGNLTVSLKQVYLDSEFISTHPPLSDGLHLSLIVSDTGSGMDQETMKRIFDPFFTTKEKGKGTGLGLATVHGIVTELGGTIIVSSFIGKGSSFEVYLPISEQEQEEMENFPEAAPQGNGEAILLVDDEEAILNFSKTMLEQLGYKVSATSSSIEALEIFQAAPEKVDLIITDQTMPGMTGSTLSTEILKISPGTPIILMTGFSETITAEKALAQGIGEYLEKPFIKSTIAHAIRMCLARKQEGEG
jgi:PAS domain S-box-containing protein